jgi:3,4-dehydroadipyl-CoA semialdehyde dehydrogenase
MTELLPNYIGGQWSHGTGEGSTLMDPVLGTPLVRVDATGLDLAAGFAFARDTAGAALRALTYRERAALLGAADARDEAADDVAFFGCHGLSLLAV